MKALKTKLFTGISMFAIALSVLIIGVWAVGEAQHINLSGSVNFTISDNTLYIKDIRVRDTGDLTGQGTTIENFLPGFVNGDIDINLGAMSADTSFSLLFDVINTSTTTYEASTISTIPNATLSVSGTIAGDGIAPSAITADTAPSGTIVLTVTVSNAGLVSLDGIVINIEELLPVEIIAQSSNSTLGTATGGSVMVGEEVTLSASFTGISEVDFLGWKESLADEDFVSSLPQYTFTYEEGSPTTYYAVFEEANNDFSYSTVGAEEGEITLAQSTTTETSIIIPAMVYRDGQSYEVTAIDSVSLTRAPEPGGMGGVFNPDSTTQSNVNLTSVVLPQTLKYIGNYTFYTSGITTINLGDCINLVEIGDEAFAYSALTGHLDLSGCTSLTSMYSAFCHCSELISVDLSGCINLTSISYYAFDQCRKLTSVTLSYNLTTIDHYVFSGCTSLTSVTFPNTTGWYVTTSPTATSGTPVDVTNPSTNASNLIGQYLGYYWKRS